MASVEPAARSIQAVAADPSALPRVSVLIPAFNAAERLPRALASVLDQSVGPIEAVVVDDASRDRTAEMVEEIARRDTRVRLIRARRNLGPGGARNVALEAARAPWIALLDSDDAFRRDRLARLLAHAESETADLVADNLLLKGEAAGTAQPMLPPELLDRPRWIDVAAFLRGNLPIQGHPRVSYGFLKPMIRRAFLKRNGLGYRDGLRFAEDFDFYVRCLLAGGRWLLLPQAGYVYSVRDDSLTALHGAGDLVRLRALDREYARESGSRAVDMELRSALLAHRRTVEDRLVWRLVLVALKRRRPKRALRLALRSSHDLRLILRCLLRDLPHVALRHMRRLSPATVLRPSNIKVNITPQKQ